jgi:hypothetical protein
MNSGVVGIGENQPVVPDLLITIIKDWLNPKLQLYIPEVLGGN